MRHSVSRAAIAAGALLLASGFLSADAFAAKKPLQPPGAEAPSEPAIAAAPVAPTQPKRPVVSPGTVVEAAPEVDVAPAAETSAAPAQPKRPVVAPGTVIEAAPVIDVTPADAEKGPVVEEAVVPPAPLEFHGLPELRGQPAEAEAAAPIRDPAEARSSLRANNHEYLFSVKPGRPDAGTPVELGWRIQEILHIPDPFLGDRRPAAPVKLIATISGPEPARTYEVHPMGSPGTYGIHFTPKASGAYKVQLDRADGKAGHRAEFTARVGAVAAEPIAAKAGGRGEELIAGRGPDDRTIDGVMAELGKRWIALERSLGTAQASAALVRVQEQVAKVAGKAPERAKEHSDEFNELAKLLVDRAGALTAVDADRGAALHALQDVQNQACMSCHTRFRFGLADSVRGWPSFQVKRDLAPPAAGVRGVSAPRGRGPVTPGAR